MSRHRNVRSMNYEDEYYDEDDVYGHSIEDNYCISPGTAAQFTYNRERNVALSNFMDEQGGIPEEDESEDTDEGTPRTQHRSSLDYTRPKLTDVDEAKLNSVLEEVRNVLGEAVPEGVMVDTIMRHNFSVEGSLNELLNSQEAPKPQREPRKDRRNRSQELDDEIDCDNCYSLQDNVFSYLPKTTGGVMKFGDSVSPQSPSFLLQSHDVSVSPLTDLPTGHIVVKQQCASFKRPLHCGLTDAGSATDGKDARKVVGGLFYNTQHGQNVQSQKLSDSTTGGTSTDHTEVKQSSPLEKQHGLRKKEAISTEQNMSQELKANTQLPLSDLAKEHYASNIPTAKKPTQSLLSDLAESQLHNSMHTSTLSEFNSPSAVVSAQNKTSAVSVGGKEDSSKDIVSNKSNETQNKLSLPSSCLTKAHLSKTQDPSSVLSNLSTEHKSKMLPALSRITLSSLSGLAKAHTDNSLSQLAKTHSENSSPLSQLAKTNTQNSSPLSQLAKAHSENSSSLSGLAKAHSENSCPLSQLAKAHSENSSSLSGLAKVQSGSSLGSSPVRLSLSQLAAADGVKTSPMSAAGKENKSDNKGNQDVWQQKSGTASEMFKNKSDKEQIMKSLSSLIEKRDKKGDNGLIEKSDKMENEIIVTRQSTASEMFKNKSDKEQIMKSLSSLIEKRDKKGDNGLIEESDKKENEIIVTRQCASLKRTETKRDGENLKDKNKESVESDNDGETILAKAKGISLADLATRKGPQLLKDTKEKLNSNIENTNKVSNSVEKDITVGGSDVILADTKKESEDLDLSDGKLTFLDDVQVENFKNHLKGPSGIGNTLCLEIKVRPGRKKGKRYKQKKFSYKCQLKGLGEILCVEMNQIKPFDFSTPSPDDIVKAKQKQAFNRSGK
ncbi:uncharacterized protein LOC123524587 isoform X1 [Mercenaria mercenaria]|uniref:uncharacterized protein LOC123524587 isoform X1 n=1 Tax=Mercenaria mercenaria TaxID=6596 RepID=UPI00234F8888|nr:uncharacterized protein LOC123524587 isoform X1 [Mercenaria mercenaria]